MKKYLSLLLAVIFVFSAFAGCADKNKANFDYSEEVLRVDGTVVKARDYDFLMSYAANQLTYTYAQLTGNSKSFQEIANLKIEDSNQTYGEYLKEYTKSKIVQNVIISNYFVESGLKFTYDDEVAFKQELDAYYKNNGTTREKFAEAIKNNLGASIDDYENLRLIDKKYSMLLDELYKVGGPREITDEAAMETFRKEAIRVKHILVKLVEDNGTPLTGDALAKAEAKYQEALEAVKALTPGDTAGFDKLIEKYGEDPGMNDSPEGYVIDKETSFVQEFLDTSYTLDVGQYGECKSTYGYHIIMRYDLRDTDLDIFLKLNISSEKPTIDDYIARLSNSDLSDFILKKADEANVEVINQTTLDKIYNRFAIKK